MAALGGVAMGNAGNTIPASREDRSLKEGTMTDKTGKLQYCLIDGVFFF